MNSSFMQLTVATLVALLFFSCGDSPKLHLTSPPAELKVIYISPGNSESDISLEPKIIVMFNQPVETADLQERIFLAKVKGEELETVETILSYNDAKFEANLEPTKKLSVSTTYAVVVRMGLKAAEGGSLPMDVIQYFTTTSVLRGEALRIIAVSPNQGAVDISPDVEPMVAFNQALDESSATSAASLSKVVGGEDGYTEIESEISVTGTDLNVIKISPKDPLDNDGEYAIRVAKTVMSKTGNSLGNDMASHFRVATDEETTGDDDDDNDDDVTGDDDATTDDNDAANDGDDLAADGDAE